MVWVPYNRSWTDRHQKYLLSTFKTMYLMPIFKFILLRVMLCSMRKCSVFDCNTMGIFNNNLPVRIKSRSGYIHFRNIRMSFAFFSGSVMTVWPLSIKFEVNMVLKTGDATINTPLLTWIRVVSTFSVMSVMSGMGGKSTESVILSVSIDEDFTSESICNLCGR